MRKIEGPFADANRKSVRLEISEGGHFPSQKDLFNQRAYALVCDLCTWQEETLDAPLEVLGSIKDEESTGGGFCVSSVDLRTYFTGALLARAIKTARSLNLNVKFLDLGAAIPK